MRIRVNYKVFLIICIFIIASCNKFLSVKPEDRVLANDVFTSKKAIENALNGIYLSMVSNDGSLYGANLSMSYVDILAQYYSISTQNQSYYTTSTYSYGEATPMGYASSIWNTSYNLILQDNQFIYNLKNSNALDSTEKNILLGEAYGIRAFLHFDLFRLFGPIYSTDSTAKSIPYNTSSAIRIDSFVNANVFASKILQDIDSAANLLLNDPIISVGVVPASTNDNFLTMRNRRYNYYANQALKARVLLYIGDKKDAYNTAKSVITSASKWFPFSSTLLSLPGIANPDRSFSSEIIFCTENFDMYNQQLSLFSATLNAYTILAPLENNLNLIFEQNTNDFRRRVNWKIDNTSDKSYPTFFKYADVTNDTLAFRKLQPLIRISEMYYIVAETASTLTEASTYLNTVRNNRGLLNVNLLNETSRESEIFKEYRKEFWGEGQLFFYYKRKYYTSILSGTLSNTTIPMLKNYYIIPLPTSETDFR